MPPTRLRRADAVTAVALGVATAVAVFAGWRAFWFLTDDAFIAFRYVANHAAGHGFVWNPEPFRPVEGYTSPLWVALLRAVWGVAGVEPPRAANALSLAFGYATLAVVAFWLARLALPAALERHRVALAGLVLAGIATNRTFLTWLSSGLETALFGFALVAWLALALTPAARRDRRWTPALCSAAAVLALVRPDGLLFFATTLGLLAMHRPRLGVGLAPLLAVPAHLVWRRLEYGAWLPNTWAAKHVGAWPESGLRYLGSFVLEYGVFVWLVLVGVWAFSEWRARSARGAARALWQRRGACLAVGALLAHFAFYTFVIGGDHFEYRVYSHLVPLLFVSALWLVARRALRPAAAYAWLAAFVLASWPIPWVHWQQTRHLATRDDTFQLAQPVAPHFPAPLRAPLRVWDGWQAWLVEHQVGVRHQEHKVFTESQQRLFPTRERGAEIGWEERAVLAWYTVGVAGWTLPEVAVIDLYGLNDAVVARQPVDPDRPRRMAHDRRPPPGYVECFRPNVVVTTEAVVHRERKRPLDDAEIRRCERRYAGARATTLNNGGATSRRATSTKPASARKAAGSNARHSSL